MLLCMLVALLAASCRKNEFNIDFHLPDDVDRTYSVLYYASDPEKGWIVEAGVSVQKGAGRLMGITREPTLIYFNPDAQVPAVAYAERGTTLIINGKSAEPLEWRIEGNEISEQLSDWRAANAAALTASASARNEAVAKAVRKNPSLPSSALLLALYYDRRENPAGFETLYKLLKDEAAESKWMTLAGRADMLDEGDAVAPELPRSMVFRTYAHGVDTVKFGKLPMIFYFNDPGRLDYADHIKLLRAFSREYADTTRRVIVNVNFTSDSLSYVSGSRRDSLRNAVSAWMPLGLNDKGAAQLGVRRLPWVVVVDARGSKVYTGSDLSAALEKMRAICK